jgi:hypothetical protein
MVAKNNVNPLVCARLAGGASLLGKGQLEPIAIKLFRSCTCLARCLSYLVEFRDY